MKPKRTLPFPPGTAWAWVTLGVIGLTALLLILTSL